MSSFISIFSGHGAETYPVSCLELPLLHTAENGSVSTCNSLAYQSSTLLFFWNKTITQKLSFCPCSLPASLSFLYLTTSAQFQIATRSGG